MQSTIVYYSRYMDINSWLVYQYTNKVDNFVIDFVDEL